MCTSLFLTLAVSLSAAEPPFTEVPAEFAGQLSPGKSPLVFNDGTPVKSAADWPKRRAEILADWHGIMGEWPPVIEKPKMEVLETTAREGISQHKVRVEIAPGQTGDGYLLRPSGAGPFPAVFVPFYDPETSAGLGGKPLRDFAWQLAR
ncbi:MAG TPA: hypothetical protein VGE39_07605, partial [Prosthecobacter sp.]